MNRILYIALFTIFFPSFVSGQPLYYKVGEKIQYSIQYGFINGGTASLELTEEVLDGKQVWHSKLLAKTTGLADAVYKVLDIYESYMDPMTELPVKSIRNIREGRYRKYNVVLFDHKSRADSSVLTSDLTGIHIAPPAIHDILSCFYYFRDNILPVDSNLKKGEITTIITWFTDEL